jgi:hypothetical protein
MDRMVSLILPLCLMAACGTGGEGGAGQAGPFSLLDQGAATLNPSGPFMTSPAWVADGSILVTRGLDGRGLYLLGTSGSVQAVDPSFHGFMEWTDRGTILCLHRGEDVEILTFGATPAGYVSLTLAGSACSPGQDIYDTQRTIFEGGGRSVLFDLWTGRLWVEGGGAGREIEASAAWGPAVSPDGTKIAFSKGHLATATLFVVDAGDGSRRTFPGAQPDWFPDGRKLVYAMPGADGGGGAVTRSDLFVYDVEGEAASPLTATPGIIEMQPAVSPDGKTVVFSDWRSGRIMAIPCAKEVTP